MSEPSPWIEEVRRIVAEVARSDAMEVEISRGSFRVLVKRQTGAWSAGDSAVIPSCPDASDAEAHHIITAPLTGVFYRSPSPGAAPYVEQGDWVEPQTVVGLIETMKVFNEVTADTTGRVAAVLAQSGQLVHAGDPLFRIEPATKPAEAPEVIS